MSDGRERAVSWDAWLLTDEAKKCLDGTARGQFLQNRLWWAYMAGWEASEAKTKGDAA